MGVGVSRRMGECPKMGSAQAGVQKVVIPIAGGHSWESANAFCGNSGATLCCAADVCDHEGGDPTCGILGPF